ncbi:MAG TPA: pilus assembly protein PilV [Spirochaetia bacterium]|nr:pilus assembly protein PilV [Spirochaetia bacterium]
MTTLRRNQGGVMLLEAMIGILIFSLGVLALVAMQAVSISNVSNARFRSEAAFLANEILSQAWVDRGTQNANIGTYKWPGGNSTVQAWVTKVNTLLPQSDIYPPTITQSVIPGMTRGQQLTVTIQWKAPDALTPSNHVAIGFVSDPAE